MESRERKKNWYEVENVAEIPSPALLVYPDRIERNIRTMLLVAGSADRLRPHVKTHKMGEIVGLQQKVGIGKFKCATLAEAEMLARRGVADILLAYQPVGPNIDRWVAWQQRYPHSALAVIADDRSVLRQLAQAASAAGMQCGVFLDINNGMDRTGIAPGEEAIRLYRLMHELPGLKAMGLHVYDGHIRESDFSERTAICEAAFAPVQRMVEDLRNQGLSVPRLVVGGSPTFPIHAGREGVDLSPGTTLLWDEGYGRSLPQPEFLPAAVLLTRVVSKPREGLLCLDLGHKAIAAEMPPPRVNLLNLGSYRAVSHSEEHLVVQTEAAAGREVGDVLYGIPMHICPTVCRYEYACVIERRRAVGQWKVEAQNRSILG